MPWPTLAAVAAGHHADAGPRPALVDRAVHPFMLKLFTITPMPGAAPAAGGNGSTNPSSPVGSPIDSSSSPQGSPARVRPGGRARGCVAKGRTGVGW